MRLVDNLDSFCYNARMNQDIIWLAGLLEGEGCFGHRGNCTTIQLQMTDEDVVQRAAKILGGVVYAQPRHSKPAHYKAMFGVSISGDKAAEWMRILLPLMGLRRQNKIKELLPLRDLVVRQHISELICPHVANYRKHRTVCASCYKKDWYRRNLEEARAANLKRYYRRKEKAQSGDTSTNTVV